MRADAREQRGVTCRHCAHRFETAARTNTRCPNCRHVVNVSRLLAKEHWDLGVLLACGHVGRVLGVPYRPERIAEVNDDWICGVCGAEDQRVAAAAGRPSPEQTPDWLLAHLVEAHPAYVWEEPLPVIKNPLDAADST